MSTDTHVLLMIRGTLAVPDLERARTLHNQTAGSPPGIAAARALGDLSHKVYSPYLRSTTSAAKAGELVFLDTWVEPGGIGRFFSDPNVQHQASQLFSKKDPTIWMRARGSFSYVLQAPAGRNERYLGSIRGPIGSPEQAIAIFAEIDRAGQRDARRRGLIGHEVFVKIPMPGDTGPAELLALDLWHDADGMGEHYSDKTHVGGLAAAFTGPPQPAAWEQAPGQWSEW